MAGGSCWSWCGCGRDTGGASPRPSGGAQGVAGICEQLGQNCFVLWNWCIFGCFRYFYIDILLDFSQVYICLQRKTLFACFCFFPPELHSCTTQTKQIKILELWRLQKPGVCHWIWWECSKDHPLGLFEALADRDCSGQNHYSTYSTCSNVMNFSLSLSSLSLSVSVSVSVSVSLSFSLSLSCDSSVQNRVLLQACQQHYHWSECELTELANIQLPLIKWPCTF